MQNNALRQRWATMDYANQVAIFNILIEEHFDDEYLVHYSLDDFVALIDFIPGHDNKIRMSSDANLIAWLLTLRDTPTNRNSLDYEKIIEPIRENLTLDEYRFLFHVRYEDCPLFANCELVSKDYLPFRLKVGK